MNSFSLSNNATVSAGTAYKTEHRVPDDIQADKQENQEDYSLWSAGVCC